MVVLYKVGGAVRDSFLGVKSKDIDYAVEASSFDEMKQYIEERGKIFLLTPEYLTIRAKVDGEDADFVLCRKEGTYSDGRRPDSVEIGDIYDDLARRDFTVNAMAIAPDGKLIDPFNGRTDLSISRLRCVGKTEDRFKEDALRMLRAMRFSITKNLRIDDDIHYCLMDYQFVKLLKNVSVERIREELNRCYLFDTKKTFHLMMNYDLIFDFIFEEMGIKLEATTKSKY